MLAQPQSAAPVMEWKPPVVWKPSVVWKLSVAWKPRVEWKPTRNPRKTNRAAMPLEAHFREAAA